MQQFLRKSLVFALLVVPFYVAMVVIWGESVPDKWRKNLLYNRGSFGHTLSRLNDAGNTQDVDILFVGASTSYRGFDTRLFAAAGYRSFNLGSSSQTPINTQLLFARYLDRLSPKLVVYEVYPETFQLDGVEASLDLLANGRSDWHALEMTLKTYNAKTLNTYIYSSWRDWTHRLAPATQPARRETDTYIGHAGFVQRDPACFRQQPTQPQEWKLNDRQLAAFAANLALLRRKHIPYILVRAPITRSLNNSYKNNTDFDQYMRKNGRYINFNTRLRLDDSLHFYDAVHLNQQGVELFNKALINVLKKQ